MSQAVAAKAASAAAGKPDWAASKILDAAAEVTAIDAKVAGKKCVTQGSAAGPLAEKIKLCKFNDDIPGSNGAYSSGDGAGGYNLVTGLGTVNIAALMDAPPKTALAGPWTVNAAAIAALNS